MTRITSASRFGVGISACLGEFPRCLGATQTAPYPVSLLPCNHPTATGVKQHTNAEKQWCSSLPTPAQAPLLSGLGSAPREPPVLSMGSDQVATEGPMASRASATGSPTSLASISAQRFTIGCFLVFL